MSNKDKWPYLPPGPPKPNSWVKKEKTEFDRRLAKMQKWNRDVEEFQKAKQAFKFSINEIFIYPIFNVIYRLIDWFKKK